MPILYRAQIRHLLAFLGKKMKKQGNSSIKTSILNACFYADAFIL